MTVQNLMLLEGEERRDEEPGQRSLPPSGHPCVQELLNCTAHGLQKGRDRSRVVPRSLI